MRPGAKVRFARKLRQSMTKPEVMLWTRLRGRSEGFSFRRQHPIGPYVADFYCARVRLIVEVDGQGHDFGEQPQFDEMRDRYFAGMGIETIRIAASSVMTQPDDVADGIWRYVQEKLALLIAPSGSTGSPPPPHAGEDDGNRE